MTRDRLGSLSPFLRTGDPQGLSVTVGVRGFPESSQRTTATHKHQSHPDAEELEEDEDEVLDDRHDTLSETTSLPSYSPGINAMPLPHRVSPIQDPDTPSRRVSRGSMMRLENILNDVSIQDVYGPRPRPRSFEQSPGFEDQQVDEISNTEFFTSPSLPETVQFGRSLSPSPVETESIQTVKKKKVKMHRCPECQKEFPRPSGLKTHMNIHTKEKPFGCTYPGCRRTFSVVSNAKRHMRTHGLGVPPEDTSDQASMPYIVGFDTPMVVEPQPKDIARREQLPFRLRWIQGTEASSSISSSATVGTMDASSGSGSSSGNAGAGGIVRTLADHNVHPGDREWSPLESESTEATGDNMAGGRSDLSMSEGGG